jgi:VWFA-related protein
VIVQDKHGNPITGLTKDDFSVFDEKQAQAIQVFSVETNAVPANAPPALPPDTYTNRLADRGAMPQSVTVILLDALNTEFSDQEYSRRQILKFLSHLQPQDRVGIYTLDYKLNVLHDFTSDSRDLIAAVANYKGEHLPDEASSVPHTVDINS